jgi:hypothetical protein
MSAFPLRMDCLCWLVSLSGSLRPPPSVAVSSSVTCTHSNTLPASHLLQYDENASSHDFLVVWLLLSLFPSFIYLFISFFKSPVVRSPAPWPGLWMQHDCISRPSRQSQQISIIIPVENVIQRNARPWFPCPATARMTLDTQKSNAGISCLISLYYPTLIQLTALKSQSGLIYPTVYLLSVTISPSPPFVSRF